MPTIVACRHMHGVTVHVDSHTHPNEISLRVADEPIGMRPVRATALLANNEADAVAVALIQATPTTEGEQQRAIALMVRVLAGYKPTLDERLTIALAMIRDITLESRSSPAEARDRHHPARGRAHQGALMNFSPFAIRSALLALLIWIAIGIAAIFTGCGGAPTMPVEHASTPVHRVDRQREIAVQITTLCGSVGSGVLLDGRHVLTAKHVGADCSHADYVLVELYDGRSLLGRRGLLYGDRDLMIVALLEGPVTGFPHPGGGDVRIGARVCAENAWPRRERRCGVIDHVTGNMFHHTFDVEHGNSGSAVYDERGLIVGVVTNIGGWSTRLYGGTL